MQSQSLTVSSKNRKLVVDYLHCARSSISTPVMNGGSFMFVLSPCLLQVFRVVILLQFCVDSMSRLRVIVALMTM